ncbi:MAG: hypothetical protein HYX90_02715 [Chloroflexi bacterium]|nr:hypothetical protein [Chloroflexota bacterium]
MPATTVTVFPAKETGAEVGWEVVFGVRLTVADGTDVGIPVAESDAVGLEVGGGVVAEVQAKMNTNSINNKLDTGQRLSLLMSHLHWQSHHVY